MVVKKIRSVGALVVYTANKLQNSLVEMSDLARAAIEQSNIPNAEIIHGNVVEINFSNFDVFYLFNPFEENLETTLKIDASVNLSGELYGKYTENVARQLAIAPLGTRVVTYCGSCEEVPLGYECLKSSLDYGLKFWEKTKNHPVRMSPQDAPATNNKWRFCPILHSRKSFEDTNGGARVMLFTGTRPDGRRVGRGGV